MNVSYHRILALQSLTFSTEFLQLNSLVQHHVFGGIVFDGPAQCGHSKLPASQVGNEVLVIHRLHLEFLGRIGLHLEELNLY